MAVLGTHRTFPAPDEYSDWTSYARALQRYFEETGEQEEAPQPKPVQLAWSDTDNDMPRLGLGGLMLFDQTRGAPTYSWNGAWEPLAPWRLVAENFPAAGYGQLRLTTPKNIADLGAGWNNLDVYDVVDPTTTRGVDMVTAGGFFTFTAPGVWQIMASLSFSHNESQQGRTTHLRIFNVTTGTGDAVGTEIFTGRNTAGSSITVPFFAELETTGATANTVGDQFRFQIGNGDTYTTVNVNRATISVTQIGTAEVVLGTP